MMGAKKFNSTGGLGDWFLVASKIYETEYSNIEWVHTESVDVGPQLNHLIDFFDFKNRGIQFRFNFDPLYVRKSPLWNSYEYVPVPVSGVAKHFRYSGLSLKNPFKISEKFQKEQPTVDLVIQCSAGLANDRVWLTDPRVIASYFRNSFGYKVQIIGNDEKFFDEQDVDNKVKKISFFEALQTIGKARYFLGISGLLPFISLSMKKNTIHKQIDSEHNLVYIHEKCKPFCFDVIHGSLPEIVSAVVRNK